MDIFISWSGPRSRAVAEALKEYLPMIVNAFNPWLSSADIDKGARWNSDLAAALATSKAGIICLTPNNFTAPYNLFDSGALSSTVEKTYVCTPRSPRRSNWALPQGRLQRSGHKIQESFAGETYIP